MTPNILILFLMGFGAGFGIGVRIGTYFTGRTFRTALEREAHSFEEASRFQ